MFAPGDVPGALTVTTVATTRGLAASRWSDALCIATAEPNINQLERAVTSSRKEKLMPSFLKFLRSPLLRRIATEVAVFVADVLTRKRRR